MRGAKRPLDGPVGIIGAMDVEIELLIGSLADARAEVVGPFRFVRGALGGTDCAIVQSGVGMVSAAACAQAMIDALGVRCILNTGVAGSLDARVGREDIVVATDAVNWMMDVQNLGYAPGETPGAGLVAFPASGALREHVLGAAREEGATVVEGRIASGDRFVRDRAEKERIAHGFGALCCEMEGAAIAQVCRLNGIPCAIVRAISDNADGSDAIDYPVFEERASRLSAAIVRRALSSGNPGDAAR